MEDHLYFDIGSIQELSSTSCDAHLKLFTLALGPKILTEPHTSITVHKNDYNYIRLLAWEENDYAGSASAGFGLVKKDGTGHGRILNSDKIICSLIEQWKTDCGTLHGRECLRLPNSKYLAPASPIWFVDVNQKCIVPACRGVSYVALSYVWGRSEHLRAAKSNIDALCKPGALDPSNREFTIPQTIRDAMTVATILDEHYLWVDALCIVQDEFATKEAQLNNMASIYAEASVTVIAKEGSDSSFGLHGIPGSLPRNLHQDVFKFNGDREAVVYPWTLDREATPWSTRGWTFQEEIFSPRKLIFEGQTVRWQCSSAVWNEDYDFNVIDECHDPDEDRILRASSIFETLEPDIAQYGRLIGAYNKRDFTYASDIMNAFAGITSTLTQAFTKGFSYGLPSSFFDLALLWQPQDTIVRRTANPDEDNEIPPSWSWGGWKGEIDTNAWAHSLENKSVSTRVAQAVGWNISDQSEAERESLQGHFPSICVDNMKSVLLCMTDRCFLHIGPWHTRKLGGSFFSLTDERDKWVGSIRPHHSSIKQEKSIAACLPPEERKCELVSISQGYVKNDDITNSNWIDEWKMDERPTSGEYYRFHNVLWIGWENGIAYRRGLGRVAEEFWREQNLDKIKLVLR